MPRPKKLADGVVSDALASLEGWTLDDGKLYREFAFADFTRAFGWMASVATVAERMNHHPEWFNVYATVRVHLTTHDAGGVTELDLELARAMNELAG